jgi:hypothetical protein
MSPHSDLPIITLDPGPRRPSREKYGALFYLGIGGLIVLTGLLAWFGFGVWSMRAVWTNIYVLHDPNRPEVERINAALALSRDPRVSWEQRWEIALRKPLPPLARYLIAESLRSEALGGDPRAFACAVAYSADWPDWLRILLTGPLARGAGAGATIPDEPLQALAARSDPVLRLWALHALAVAHPDDHQAAHELERAATSNGPHRDLAERLLAALRAQPGPERVRWLDEATRWLRSHYPPAKAVWEGWEDRGDRIVKKQGEPNRAGAGAGGPN